VGTIASLNASPIGSTPPTPAVTGITSGTPSNAFNLYLIGSFGPNVSGINWFDGTTTTSLDPSVVTPTQITVSVPAALYSTIVAFPVAITITEVEGGTAVSNPATFFVNPPLTPRPGPIVENLNQPVTTTIIDGGSAPYAVIPGPVPPGQTIGPGQNSAVVLSGAPTATGIFSLTPSVSDFWKNNQAASLIVQVVAPATLTAPLSPQNTAAGSPDLNLTINGNNFVQAVPAQQLAGSVVLWKFGNNPLVTLTTTFNSVNQLQAVVPASLLLVPGTASVTVLQPNDSVSNALPFDIVAPAITSLSTSNIAAGSPAFLLAVNGSRFLPGSVVVVNGSSINTTFVNSGQLTLTVPANLLTATGVIPVLVVNPGGANSNVVNLVVNPAITGLSPSSVPAGSAAFPLSVSGAGFVLNLASSNSQSIVSFNGVSLPTTVVNAGLLTTNVPANLVTTVGSFPVVVTNPGNNASAPATFAVTPALAILTTSLPSGQAGSLYTVTLIARGGTTPYTWSATGLPAALGINPTTGVIAGVPLQSGNSNVVVTLKDSAGTSVTAQFPLAIAPPPVTISTGGLPNGTVGVPYIGIIGATGGSGGYTFSLGGGKLPDGLSLGSDGTVKGTPQTPGVFTLSVNVTDSSGSTSGRDFTITIAPAPLVVTGGPPPSGGTAGMPITITFGGSGGVPPYKCSIAGTLPPGMTFANCTLSGTPSTPGTYTFRVTVTDSTGISSTKDFSLSVAPPTLVLTATGANGQVGVAYSGQFTATGGVPPYAYSATGLPDGLTVASASGAITGTPSTAGQYSIAGTVSDSTGTKANATLSITIIPATLAISTSSLPDGTVNTPYSASLAASGGTPPYTFAVSGLPDGLSATPAGAISGTPTTAGKFTVSVTVTDKAGATAAQRYSVTIAPPPLTITSTSLANAIVGTAYSATVTATGGVSPLTWSATGLPGGLTISSTGTISGTAGAPGSSTVTLTVKDNSGTTAVKPLSLSVVLPPAPPLSFSGVLATSPPAQQPQLQVSLGTTYPVDVIATLTLTFAPDSGGDDPSIVFATGGRTTKITIPAGSTVGATTVGLQTGTVAGLITITAQLQASGQDVTPTPAPRFTTRIAAMAPVPTTVTAARNSTGFSVTIAGYVTDREITQVIYAFNAAPGSNLQTASLTVPVDTLFSAYFSGTSAAPFGGQFSLLQPFTINGTAQAVVSVTVTMVNKIGQSTPVTVNLN
jgi:hypothetical protein